MFVVSVYYNSIHSNQNGHHCQDRKQGIMKLRQYQEQGVQETIKMLRSRKSALLADEMGLGKTAQAIAIATRLKCKHVVVVCPASLRLNWKDEIEKWGSDDCECRVL